jgi:hypothetical protein
MHSAKKECSTCRKRLPLEQFGRNQRAADKLNCRCRRCLNAAARRCYANPPGRPAGPRGPQRRNPLGIVGIYLTWNGKRFEARVGRRWLGTYDSVAEAVAARAEAEAAR